MAAAYEITDPTVDSQVVNLKSSGAEALLVAGTPKFAAQAIRKASEIGWKPTILSELPVEFRRGDAEACGPRQIDRGHRRDHHDGSDRRPVGQ